MQDNVQSLLSYIMHAMQAHLYLHEQCRSYSSMTLNKTSNVLCCCEPHQLTLMRLTTCSDVSSPRPVLLAGCSSAA